MSNEVDWSQKPVKTAGKDDKKEDLLQEAKGINSLIAFGELIDNTLGNFEYNYLTEGKKETRSLNIDIELKFKGEKKYM